MKDSFPINIFGATKWNLLEVQKLDRYLDTFIHGCPFCGYIGKIEWHGSSLEGDWHCPLKVLKAHIEEFYKQLLP